LGRRQAPLFFAPVDAASASHAKQCLAATTKRRTRRRQLNRHKPQHCGVRTFPERNSQISRDKHNNRGDNTMSKKTMHTLLLVFATLVLAIGSVAQIFLHQ
jgi:hypothetical protein